MTFTPCEAETSLADAEIVAIVRGMAGSADCAEGISVILLAVDCRLNRHHQGPCAAWAANARDGFGTEATAWLRWSETARTVDWLADCMTAGCPLFRGHQGDCDPCLPVDES
jgi:hypothetical protein